MNNSLMTGRNQPGAAGAAGVTSTPIAIPRTTLAADQGIAADTWTQINTLQVAVNVTGSADVVQLIAHIMWYPPILGSVYLGYRIDADDIVAFAQVSQSGSWAAHVHSNVFIEGLSAGAHAITFWILADEGATLYGATAVVTGVPIPCFAEGVHYAT